MGEPLEHDEHKLGQYARFVLPYKTATHWESLSRCPRGMTFRVGLITLEPESELYHWSKPRHWSKIPYPYQGINNIVTCQCLREWRLRSPLLKLASFDIRYSPLKCSDACVTPTRHYHGKPQESHHRSRFWRFLNRRKIVRYSHIGLPLEPSEQCCAAWLPITGLRSLK